MKYPATFPTTHWTLVASAGSLNSEHAKRALERLAELYWQPMHGYLQARGRTPEDAADLVQSFFLRFFEQGHFAKANPQIGRFRTFLLSALKNFVTDAWRHENAEVRRPAEGLASLDQVVAESTAIEAIAPGPDQEFDRNWLTSILVRNLEKLRRHFEEKNQGKLGQHLCGYLAGDPLARTHAEVGDELGLSAEVVRQAASRARVHLRNLILEEISDTVSASTQVEEELRELLRAWHE